MAYKLVGIGEVLWDLLPDGRRLGGAPANYATHAANLGARSSLISRVGQDDLGREALRRLSNRKVSTDCIGEDAFYPTGTVSVIIETDGQAKYHFPEKVAWDEMVDETKSFDLVADADAICYGTLAQRQEPSRSSIQRLLRATSSVALRVFDVNLRQNFHSPDVIEKSLTLANALKVNEFELPHLAKILGLIENEREQLAELAARYRLRLVAYTRGQNGSLLLANGRWSDHPGIRTQVADTIGAGDAFTAAMTLGFLSRWDLDKVNDAANQIAAFVCSCPGATPELPEDMRTLFQ